MKKNWVRLSGGVLGFVLMVMSVSIPTAHAGRTWVLRGADVFSGGELDGVSVLSSGELLLSPAMTPVEGLDAVFVWDIKAGEDGDVLVATGSPGAVYEVEDGAAKLRYKTAEEHVLSVLRMPDGAILAATAPRGLIYRIAPDDSVTVFANLDVHYIWEMEHVGDDLIYCATGPGGQMISLTHEGAADVVFTAPRNNLLCMAVDADRDIVYTGTQPGGLVYEISRNGDPTVLFDARENEIRDMVISADGALLVSTAQSEQQRGQESRAPGANGAPRMDLAPAESAEMLPGQPDVPNSIYRIEPGKGAFRMAELQNALVLSLACRQEGGEVLAGTGVDGRLIGVRTDGRTRILTDTGSRHVSALSALADGNVLMGASNPGMLMLLGAEFAPEGAFISEVFDAEYLSRWGAVSWLGTAGGETSLKVYLRTGNAASPDTTWSEWTGPAQDAAGELLEVPMGRFAQIRIVLATEDGAGTPELNQVSVHYRQANRRPAIAELDVSGENQDMTITWNAVDPNGDELQYDLFFRGADERNWRALEEGLREKNSYCWDTARTPDGYYLIQLVASDSPSRGLTETLQDEKVYGPFLVNNSAPRLLDLEFAERQIERRFVITGVAADSVSRIGSIKVSHNSGEWQPVFPDDGMFDSRQESFTFATARLDEGQHVFVFIATDEAGNTGSGKIVIDVEAQ